MSSLSINLATINDAEIISEISRKTFYDSFAAEIQKKM